MRGYACNEEKIWGWNFFYDYRGDHAYHQIGCGFEWLGDDYDLRLNGYLPIGKIFRESHSPFVVDFPGGFVLDIKHRIFATRGIDAEIGTWFRNECTSRYFDLYGAIGPYVYYKQFHSAFVGGRVRLLAQFTDSLSLEAEVTYDAVFKTVGQGRLTYSWSFGEPSCGYNDSCLSRAFYDPVHRQEIIVNRPSYRVYKQNW